MEPGWTSEARRRAKLAAEATGAFRGLGFEPRQLLVSSGEGKPDRFVTELAPGTRVTPAGHPQWLPTLQGEIVRTLNESFDGPSGRGGLQKGPLYLIRWTTGATEPCVKLPCKLVHDPEYWLVETVSNAEMLNGLPSRSRRTPGAVAADDLDAASLPSSVPTSAISAESTNHGNKRFAEREMAKRDFQSAIKAHLNMHKQQPEELFPGLPNKFGSTVLIVHNDMVFCTDPELRTCVSAWRHQKQGDTGVIHHLKSSERPELNNRRVRLLEYSDGGWLVDLGDEQVRIQLRNIRPPKEHE